MVICEFEKGKRVPLRHAVVDNIVIKDNKILLEKRNPEMIEGGKWCLPGGYMEMNETIEEALRRETLEETGYQVKNVRLFRIIDNPNRPNELDRQNISFVHLSEIAEKIGDLDFETDRIEWFELDNLPPKEQIAFDHASNIEWYKKYLEKPFDLPIIG